MLLMIAFICSCNKSGNDDSLISDSDSLLYDSFYGDSAIYVVDDSDSIGNETGVTGESGLDTFMFDTNSDTGTPDTGGRWLQLSSVDFIQVSAGRNHSCGVSVSGSIYCWGSDLAGQSSPPEGTFFQVSTAATSSCAIDTAGLVECWPDEVTPSTAATFNQIDMGWWHGCGVTTEDTIECWGPFAYDVGQADAPGGDGFVQVSGGFEEFSCATMSDGSVPCWKYPSEEAPPGVSFVKVSVGYTHACGLSEDMELICWGSDSHGESSPPSGTYIDVSAGELATCAISSAGEIDCWGDDDYGETTEPESSEKIFTQVSLNANHACALRSDNKVLCWGRDSYGEIYPP
jgi:alpha-tubulin suppressor-like RCC1 family protein